MKKLSYQEIKNLERGDLIIFIDKSLDKYETFSIIVSLKEQKSRFDNETRILLKDFIIKENDENNLYKVIKNTLIEKSDYFEEIEIYKVA